MADNNTIRSYRSNDPHRRGSGSATAGSQPGGGDPLAELARLIGQSDPFADVGQTSPRRTEPQRPAPQPSAPPHEADWRKAAAAMRPFEDEPAAASDRYEPPASSGYARQGAYADEPRGDDRYTDDRFRDQYPDERSYQDDRQYADDRSFAQPRYVQPHPSDPASADPFHEHQDDRDDERLDDRRYAADLHDTHGAAYYDEGAPMGPHDEELYDDPPRSRGRNGLITAVTLVACAMIGTAGAYGYRTYYSGTGSGKTPPVITAETTPSKVVSAVDSAPTKSFQDRVGDPAQNERVVSREEQPVEFKSPTATSPRIVLPAPVAPSQQPGAAPTAPVRSGGIGQQTTASIPPGGSSATTTAGSEPKRVRTVTIRPDGTDLEGRPVGGLGAQSATIAAPPARSGNAKSSQGGRGSGPLSLDPQAGPPVAAAPAPAPLPAAPAAPQLASAPASVPSGGYTVQLSSQRSEAEAQSSFRALQAKFPDQLGNRSPIIRRADLGDKGVYYRAMVGPFGSSDEASRFCSSYKAAGGQCIIQRN